MSILIFGSINVDYVMQVERISRPGETNKAHEIKRFFGGKGANQATAAARASSGIAVLIAGAIGDDEVATGVKQNFVNNGVNVDLIQHVNAPTGTAYIFVDPDAENAITIVAGSNDCVDEGLLPDRLLSEVSYLVLQMEVPLDQMLKLAKRYKKINLNGKILFNVAPVPTIKQKLATLELLDISDYLVVNEHEAAAVLNLIDSKSTATDMETARILSDKFDIISIITLGKKGAITATNNNIILSPAFEIAAIDTTGAGDTFVGVLATKLAEGEALDKALKFACKAGALACLKMGAQEAMPTAEELILNESD
ncbi:MAG: ribokinase [Rhizobiales bacterium]|nr:ribokinase [Hyphomicrobiales bacterium]NRB13877.1 ribokinase [Hyphomicrobiales bacterium]